ncbi:MAG: ABC transporter permease [Thermoanaerobaculia bacterium]|nr:ABC transporter permease [Thermoanaerobaculia bacterium]
MQVFLQDLRYGLRSLRKSWALSLAVVLTLALGIGANTLVYSLVDSAVLNPFPFPDPDRLVGVGSEWPRQGRELGFFETLSPPEYLDTKRQTETLERVVMWDLGYRAVTTGTERAEVLLSAFWFDDAFPTLGVAPHLGRGFSPEELADGAAVALLSHRYWRSRLGADPEVLGRVVQVDGTPFTLIGIMPPRGQILGSDLWIPMGAGPERFPRNRRNMQMLARLAADASLEEANAELAAISGRIEQEHGAEFEEYAGWRMRALPWTDVNVRRVRPAAIALMSAVGFVLMIICANVGSLFLAKSAARRLEIAVRGALGATRGRIVRQLLTESVVLALVGGALGLGLTHLAVSGFLQGLVARIPFVAIEISLNSRVLLYTFAIATVTGLVFGLAPALHGTRVGLLSTLKLDGGGSIGSMSRQRLQRAFVGAEVTVALVLLAQAGLMVNSFVRLQTVDPGFDTTNTLTMRLTLPHQRYRSQAEINAFFADLTDRVEALPGVARATAATQYPPLVSRRNAFGIEGQVYRSSDELPASAVTIVTEGFHEALGVPLLRGRTFAPTDTLGAPRVAVVNETAAQRFFPDGAIGRRIRVGSPEAPWTEIVGVVGAVRNRGPEFRPEPEIFANLSQVEGFANQLFLMVKTEADARSLLPAVQEQVRALDPRQEVYAVTTLDEAFAAITAPRRLGTLALVGLAVFALALAASGIYAVVAYGVAERRREIGLRVALGATGQEVRRFVVRQAMVPVAIGGVLGLAAALALGRLMGQFLIDIEGSDPLTLVAVALLLLSMAAAASYLPARRASRMDPTLALRNE